MELADKKVTVVGIGRSGLAAARLLARHGANPFLTDSRSEAAILQSETVRAQVSEFAWETGGHSAEAWADTSLVVLSPGVPPKAPGLQGAWESGVEIISELELASRLCTARIAAVTGTNGKTTTTELLFAMLKAGGLNVGLAGNNAVPLSEALLIAPPPAWLVLEVSSYALETAVSFRPDVAAVLNLSPDHLGRHGSMEVYASVKARIFARQRVGNTAVLNLDDEAVAAMAVPEGVTRRTFSTGGHADAAVRGENGSILAGEDVIANVTDIPIPGRHNLENSLAAIACCRAIDAPWEGCLAGLRAFQAVEHRLEKVCERDDGAVIYNDSKSTNLDSLRVALESFDRPVVLIAGGEGKGSDYGVLAGQVAAQVKMLFAVGSDAPKIVAAFGGVTKVVEAGDLTHAVPEALAAAGSGDVVLLSPGCASFDQYANFEERGRHFKELVWKSVGQKLR
jgi:UDP-N-acetylmuramoylalanine--D-glutamate ligase